MTNDVTTTAQDIAKVIPNCPTCGSGRYYSVTENAKHGFRLTALRCEVCEFNVLVAFHNLMPTSRPHKSSPALLVALACMVVVELALLVEILVLE